MAVGAVVGSAIGAALAQALKFDQGEWEAGIYGFNPTLVGIATFFFFQLGVVSIGLMAVGCVVATLLTRAMRKHLPFPTYTTPFIVTTWAVFFLGRALGAEATVLSGPLVPNLPLGYLLTSVLHGIGQVMFQDSVWTGMFLLAGIAVSDREHGGWVLLGSVVGMLVASYHVSVGADSIDPERLIERARFDNIQLGLYGYNATLAPVALFLRRRSLLAPLLGILLAEPLTELMPLLGLPALTAPFVLATWIVLVLAWLEGRLFGPRSSPAN
ncbi:MAG: urea transporter [Gemmataceae bacterium]